MKTTVPLTALLSLPPLSDELLQRVLKHVMDTRPDCSAHLPAPPRGYEFVVSRKSAARLAPDAVALVSGAAGDDVELADPLCIGYHLVLCPLRDGKGDESGKVVPYTWFHESGTPMYAPCSSAIFDAREMGGYLATHLTEQSGFPWGCSISMSDGHTARRDTIHVHIVLTPALSILAEHGLELTPFVDPRVRVSEKS